jgi:hypothetical protein
MAEAEERELCSSADDQGRNEMSTWLSPSNPPTVMN